MRQSSTLVTADERTIGLLYITDLGPHQEIERKRERLLRPRHLSGPLYEKMRQAEVTSSQDIYQEGLHYLPGAQTLSREGHPEREIIQCASEWKADLIVICPRSPVFGGPAVLATWDIRSGKLESCTETISYLPHRLHQEIYRQAM